MFFVYLLLLIAAFASLALIILFFRFLWMVPTELRELKIYLHLIEKTLDK